MGSAGDFGVYLLLGGEPGTWCVGDHGQAFLQISCLRVATKFNSLCTMSQLSMNVQLILHMDVALGTNVFLMMILEVCVQQSMSVH